MGVVIFWDYLVLCRCPALKPLAFFAPGAHGANNATEGGRTGPEHQRRRRAQAAHSHLQDLQGPSCRPDGAAVRWRCCH